MSKTTQNGINHKLWDSINFLRGPIGLNEYKNYILSLLFFKYISDVWVDVNEEYKTRYATEEDTKSSMDLERFVLDDDCTFNYISQYSKNPDIGERINQALLKVELLNSDKLGGVFRNVDFKRLGDSLDKNKRLEKLFQIFNHDEFDFRPSISGHETRAQKAFSYLIEQFAMMLGKVSGDFHTPQEVSRLLGKLLSPKVGSSIYDPSCGSGSLLLSLANEVKDKEGNISKDFSLYGQETITDIFAICKMNLCLHGLDENSSNIKFGNTITNPSHIEREKLKEFDIAIANPPFSLHWDDLIGKEDYLGRFERGVPPRSKADYAFILHTIESLKENGRMGIIMPHGVLFRGSTEGKIRRKLIEENLLEAVIGLPANLFYGTGIPVVILIFNKAKGTNTDILFIDASEKHELGRKQNKLIATNIDEIVEIYEAFRNGVDFNSSKYKPLVDKFARRVPFQEVIDNDFNLNIPRYVDTSEDIPPVDVLGVQQEIDILEKELLEVKVKMKEYLNRLTLIQVNNHPQRRWL